MTITFEGKFGTRNPAVNTNTHAKAYYYREILFGFRNVASFERAQDEAAMFLGYKLMERLLSKNKHNIEDMSVQLYALNDCVGLMHDSINPTNTENTLDEFEDAITNAMSALKEFWRLAQLNS